MDFEDRYSLISDGSRPEEIVLLQGRGCFWKKCAFCDYYTDSAPDEKSLELNRAVLKRVTGETGRLTVLNSGSFFELSPEIQEEILKLCIDKNIKFLTVEAHWKYRHEIKRLKEALLLKGITLQPRIGIETFNEPFRETVLKKGFGSIKQEELFSFFDEGCLLYGIEGQTQEMLLLDLIIALTHFKQVYLNLYEERPGLKKDGKLISQFMDEIYPVIKDIDNLKVMINTTDLGVGE